MSKAKLSMAAVLSTTAIVGGVLLSSVNSAHSCMRTKSAYKQRYEQASWIRSPWVAVITLPGIALATALSLGGQAYKQR